MNFLGLKSAEKGNRARVVNGKIPTSAGGTRIGPRLHPCAFPGSRGFKILDFKRWFISGWPVWLELLHVFQLSGLFLIYCISTQTQPRTHHYQRREPFLTLHRPSGLKSPKPFAVPLWHPAPLGPLAGSSHCNYTMGRDRATARACGDKALPPEQRPPCRSHSERPHHGGN